MPRHLTFIRSIVCRICWTNHCRIYGIQFEISNDIIKSDTIETDKTIKIQESSHPFLGAVVCPEHLWFFLVPVSPTDGRTQKAFDNKGKA